MIRAVFAVAAFFCLSLAARADFTPPKAAGFGAGRELDLRTFWKKDPLTALAEAEQRWETDGRDEKDFTLGAYYRVLDPLRLGLFYRRSYGVRHNDDWVNPGAGWGWSGSGQRAEDLVIADASPRAQLSFLPGESWVAELKVRFQHNFFDGERTLSLRPGLTYFWLREDEPFLNFFLQYELALPLNYGDATLNDQWLYGGALYQLLEPLQIGAFVAYHRQTWSTSSAFLAKFAIPYHTSDRSLLFGLSAILQL